MKFSHDPRAFSNPASGAALQIHINLGADGNRLQKIDKDGLIFIDLMQKPNSAIDANQTLCSFLSGIFNIPQAQIEIAAGHNGNDKIVCLFNMPADRVNQCLALHLAK